jgi:transcriptional regulator with XRE-family HTH domain
MNADPVALAAKLKDARMAADLTQEQVASALALPHSAIFELEAGQRDVSTLQLARLAHVYGRSIASFFEEEAPSEEQVALVARLRTANVDGDELSHALRVYRAGVELVRLLQSDDADELARCDPNREMVARVIQLTLEAYQREKISQGKLRDLSSLLGISASTLLDQAEAAA